MMMIIMMITGLTNKFGSLEAEIFFYFFFVSFTFFLLLGDTQGEVCTFVSFFFFLFLWWQSCVSVQVSVSVYDSHHSACCFNEERDAPTLGQRWRADKSNKAVPPWDAVFRLHRLCLCLCFRWFHLVSVFTKRQYCSYIRVNYIKYINM